MRWKEILRSVLNRQGYDIRRYVASCGQNTNVLDLAVRCRLSAAASDRFFLVQIGANDGELDDPVCSLIKRHRLAGVLVEPMPECFARLRENYADQPQIALENCAIAQEDGHRELFRIRRGAYPHLPKAECMASFDRKVFSHCGKLLPGVERHIEVIQVPTMTVASLAAKHGIDHLDLVQVDTEGFDFEIIKLLLEAKLLPNIIHYEHFHLSAQDQRACRQRLMEHGYTFSHTPLDTLAVRNV